MNDYYAVLIFPTHKKAETNKIEEKSRDSRKKKKKKKPYQTRVIVMEKLIQGDIPTSHF